MNLVPLRKIAAAMEVRDESPGLFERAIRDGVCARCSHAVASGGDYCVEHLAETCPLAVYGQRVVAAEGLGAGHYHVLPSTMIDQRHESRQHAAFDVASHGRVHPIHSRAAETSVIHFEWSPECLFGL